MAHRIERNGEDRFLKIFWRELGGCATYIKPREIPRYAGVSKIHARNAADDVLRAGHTAFVGYLQTWANFLSAFENPMTIPNYYAQLEKLRDVAGQLRQQMTPDARLAVWINDEVSALQKMIASRRGDGPQKIRCFAEGRSKLAANVLGSYEALYAQGLNAGRGPELRYLIAQCFENRPLRAAAGISQVAMSIAAIVVAGGVLLFWPSDSQSANG